MNIVDPGLAIQAAEFSADEKAPMADSIIYVLAKTHDATLWTQDQDLKDLPNVKFQEKNANHCVELTR